VMLELDYALEKDKPEAPCLELMVLMSLCRLTRRILPLGNLKIIKGGITEGILGAIPDSTDAKKYMASIEEKI
jgi:hypothetical protein